MCSFVQLLTLQLEVEREGTLKILNEYLSKLGYLV